MQAIRLLFVLLSMFCVLLRLFGPASAAIRSGGYDMKLDNNIITIIGILIIAVFAYLILNKMGLINTPTPVSTQVTPACPRGKSYQQSPLEILSYCDPGYSWNFWGGECECKGV